jgi:hypothetical protein
MEDEKGPDSKVVVSTPDDRGRARHALSPPVRDEIASFFRRYKQGEPGKFSRVNGWGSAAAGRELVMVTGQFFEQCQTVGDVTCRVALHRGGAAMASPAVWRRGGRGTRTERSELIVSGAGAGRSLR